ncbi:hypothetical protein TYRP_009350 [Tyrophagus putrescentiae]|nr:hypothetical protein TYRP_009350 [Tyrophagus putrescentiae]
MPPSPPSPLHPCPRSCSCPTTTINSSSPSSSPLIVNCTDRGLVLLPLLDDLPTWTEVLLLAGNPLERLAVAPGQRLMVTPSNLTRLDFASTSLRGALDPAFLSSLFNDVAYIEGSLTSVSFDLNSLTSLPLFSSASGLRSLSVVGNRIESEAMANVDLGAYFPVLETLDLSDNPLGSIPRHFLSAAGSTPHYHLHTLVLHNTRIESIEAGAFDRLPALVTLKLSRNGLHSIGNHWLGGLPALRELDLNSNRIEAIGPLAFNGSKSLEVLKLRRNRLEALADGAFWGLSRLRRLVLDHNNLTDVRLGWTYGLRALVELTLRHNQVREIAPGAWTPTPALAELHLSHNHLTTVDGEAFAKLPALKTLKLNGNRITVILEAAFAGLPSLETLDLAENSISVALESSNEGLFSKLKSLKRLHLESNQIRLLQKGTFAGLAGHLQVLGLSGNPISSIQNGTLSGFRELLELGLAETDLVCDCTLKWLHGWLSSGPVIRRNTFAPAIRCKHPNELHRRTTEGRGGFLEASPEDFHCRHWLKPHLLDDYASMLDRPLSAIKGKNMTFYCKVATSAADRVTFQWIKDGKVVSDTSSTTSLTSSSTSSNPRIKVETLASAYSANATLYTNVLTVLNVADEDAGAYQCVAGNAYDSVYSHKFTVAVHVVPYFIKRPQAEITVRVGGTARLECAARGQPAPVVSWRKLGATAEDGTTSASAQEHFPAAEERRMRFIPSDDVYFIVDVTKADAGSYSCNASNDAGTAVSSLTLNVIEPPSFVRPLADKVAPEGGMVSLECMAAGLPMPKVTWYRGDSTEAMVDTQRHFFTAQGQLLIIVKLREEEDGGRYRCRIDNEYGSAEGSFVLKIGEGGGGEGGGGGSSELSKYRSPPAAGGDSRNHLDSPATSRHLSPPSTKYHRQLQSSSSSFSADFSTGLLFLRTHLFIMLIIVLVVVLTSIIWIAIICHLRRVDNGRRKVVEQQQQQVNFKKNNRKPDDEGGEGFEEEQLRSFDSGDPESSAAAAAAAAVHSLRRGGEAAGKPLLFAVPPYTTDLSVDYHQLLHHHHHHHHHPQHVHPGYQHQQSLGYESEASSAKDTGIEGSSQSTTTDDPEEGGISGIGGDQQHFSYTPADYRDLAYHHHHQLSSNYRSLPRNQGVLRSHPQTTTSSDLYHHYHQPAVVASVLSTNKERKRALKREKDLQISTCKILSGGSGTPTTPSSPLKTFSPAPVISLLRLLYSKSCTKYDYLLLSKYCYWCVCVLLELSLLLLLRLGLLNGRMDYLLQLTLQAVHLGRLTAVVWDGWSENAAFACFELGVMDFGSLLKEEEEEELVRRRWARWCGPIDDDHFGGHYHHHYPPPRPVTTLREPVGGGGGG